MNFDHDRMNWIRQQAYSLTVTTKPEVLAVIKNGAFSDLVMLALGKIMWRQHHDQCPLVQVYQDLLEAWQMALFARPILMDEMTFGEFVRWYELTIFPTFAKTGRTTTA